MGGLTNQLLEAPLIFRKLFKYLDKLIVRLGLFDCGTAKLIECKYIRSRLFGCFPILPSDSFCQLFIRRLDK